MSISLYDATVDIFIRQLDALSGVMAKGREFYSENGLDLDGLSDERLCGDMLPLNFQINSVRNHSIGAVEAVKSGQAGPPKPMEATDFASLEAVLKHSADALKALSRDEVNALAGRDVAFVMGDFRIPFAAEGYFTSFAIPNFMFHAATAYDILRMKGVPLGKRDFLGQLAVKAG